MSCHRCSGLLVVDHLIDMQDNSGHLWLRGLRCVNCGAISDPLINRRRTAGVADVHHLTRPAAKKPAKSPAGAGTQGGAPWDG